MWLNNYRDKFIDKLSCLLSTQWKMLGIPLTTTSEKINFVIDIEPLILLSLTVFRFYPRIFDEVINWLYSNGTLVNTQRLKNILKTESFASKEIINAVADFLATKKNQPKWKGLIKKSNHPPQSLFLKKDLSEYPQFGEDEPIFRKHNFIRGKITLRNNTILEITDNPSYQNLKLRLLFGVNTRAEIINYLLLAENGNSNNIARETFFYQKTVYDILKELNLSNLVFSKKRGKAIDFQIEKEKWHSFLNITQNDFYFINLVHLYKGFDLMLQYLMSPPNNNSPLSEYNFLKLSQKTSDYLSRSHLKFPPIKNFVFSNEQEFFSTILQLIDSLYKH